MPAYTQASLGRLRGIDEAAAPLSSEFTNNFDLATVEATVPLADKAIFLGPNGGRWMFAKIPEETAGTGDPVVGSIQSTSYGYAPSSPATQVQPEVNIPTEQRSPSNASTVRRRPLSGASPVSPQYASGRGPSEAYASTRATEPRSPTEDMTQPMAQLNLNQNCFSAAPFYGHSDGGALAAETLTDHSPVPSLPIPQSPAMHSPIMHYPNGQNLPPGYGYRPYPVQNYSGPPNGNHNPTMQTRPVDPNYGYYSPGMDQQYQSNPHLSMPSVMDQSHPMLQSSTNPMTISPTTPQQQQGYFQQPHQLQPPSPNFGLHPPNASSQDIPYVATPRHDEMRRSSEGNSYQYSARSPAFQVTDHIYGIPNGEHHYDTQTPVVVIPPRPQQPTSNSSRSDGASTGRDNVLPGEDVLYDGYVKIAQGLSAPFFDAILKVFRNTLSNDLRFHSKIGYDSETYFMKGANAQLIPIYAYDQRSTNVLYIRDNDTDKRNPAAAAYSSPTAVRLYQFSRLQELFDFQAKLTGEKIVLDISSVRLLRFRKASSRSNESFSSVRVQIWHEEGAARRAGGASDVASFVTAGTALSGPMRDRLVPNSSRLVVFLGRLDEYITVYVTDDIEVVPEGQTMVKIRPRKGGKFKRGVSRWPGVKARREEKRGSEPAGIDIHGQTTDPDVVASFDLYETFDIEFENSPSQHNFVQKWEEVIKARRLQRIELEKIQEDMQKSTLTGKTARVIW